MPSKWDLGGLVIATVIGLELGVWHWTSDAHRWEKIPLPADREDRFIANPEGLWLRWFHWSTERPKGTVVVAHGYGEHARREGYQILAKELAKLGLEMYAIDHQGHGASCGERAYAADFLHLPRDFKLFIEQRVRPAREKAGLGSTPLFVLGHSMGGLITSEFLGAGGVPELTAAILSGPAFEPDPDEATPAKIGAAEKIEKYLPRFPLPGLPLEEISRNPSVVSEYRLDPLNYAGPMRARLAIGMLKSMLHSDETAKKVSLPFLIIHGGADKLCRVSGAQRWHDVASTPAAKKQIKIYPGVKHELFEDAAADAVFADIASFLSGFLKK
eukprot:Hpha_TRINITY_DN15130_c0_g2::TRINITY_DN15130_c0_g2_i1::g.129251::m.129251/K01054/MGLL; acylglycerol lipase